MYTKLLVGKYSPENHCHAADGEPLTILPRANAREHQGNPFLSLNHKTVKSKYGWVKQVEPFTLDDFIGNIAWKKGIYDEQEAREHLTIMLESIARLEEGTPVTADYTHRGIIERKIVLSVHQVIFYHIK